MRSLDKSIVMSNHERWVDHFQMALSEVVKHLYIDPMEIKNAIDIGSGEGASTKAILNMFPNASVVALDYAVEPKVQSDRLSYQKDTLQRFVRRSSGNGFELVLVAHVDGLKISDIEKIVSKGGVVVEINCTIKDNSRNMKLEIDEGIIPGEIRVWVKN